MKWRSPGRCKVGHEKSTMKRIYWIYPEWTCAWPRALLNWIGMTLVLVVFAYNFRQQTSPQSELGENAEYPKLFQHPIFQEQRTNPNPNSNQNLTLGVTFEKTKNHSRITNRQRNVMGSVDVFRSRDQILDTIQYVCKNSHLSVGKFSSLASKWMLLTPQKGSTRYK